ncbi:MULTISPECIES: HAD-IA family hydrolase [unclassified Synechococcus]|uniref:HAD-IA family hydrolase n=1 Tax=unclassified Synechococcus TaxID=2626047 RepID=UPI0000699354|nr:MULTISPECIES: HAD-IA family hydrolase [unclassified Synechococcus]EAQ76323.1 HAD-superfamily hydrolase, subfamily IA, variant 1 [Synechococcus sp. WH 5701]WFN59007.1 HAD-IA family hydrolase [Synechococcus sp. CCFWC 502]CAK6692981.1 Phosphoglycolate phosphatase [Synechococcus sp. CBW1107]
MRESLNPGAPAALLLDAMGTLIGLRRSVGHTYADVARRHGVIAEPEAIDQAFPAVLRQAPPLAFPGLEGPELLSAEQQWWHQRIEDTLRSTGGNLGELELPPQLALELFERFAEPDLWRVYPDVIGPIGRWHGAGLRLAVVSNFDQRLHGLLEALGLAQLLELVVVSSAAGAAKPSPKPFELALEGLELRPEQVWHVGDSPEDLAGARAAGITCLLIRRH